MKTVVVYSGGLDSTALLYQLIEEKHQVSALTINYGQRHQKEIEVAKDITAKLSIQHEVADLRGITHLLAGSSLTSSDIEVPEGHYEEDNMKATVVPNRNMILLSVAVGWAISLKYDSVAYAAHSGDHAIYPDCRQEFIDGMASVIPLADWHKIKLSTPFSNKTKADIATIASRLNVPLAETWSCYNGLELHCGKCGTCIERREAFHLAKLDDPTSYLADAPTLNQLIANNWKI